MVTQSNPDFSCFYSSLVRLEWHKRMREIRTVLASNKQWRGGLVGRVAPSSRKFAEFSLCREDGSRTAGQLSWRLLLLLSSDWFRPVVCFKGSGWKIGITWGQCWVTLAFSYQDLNLFLVSLVGLSSGLKPEVTHYTTLWNKVVLQAWIKWDVYLANLSKSNYKAYCMSQNISPHMHTGLCIS